MRESDREGRIMIKVIKKDGTKEEFNVQKVVVAVNKSAYRALVTFTTLSRKKWSRCARRKLRSQICIMWSKVH